jgi:hypothetical protein
MKCDICGDIMPISLEYIENDKYITKYICKNNHEIIIQEESPFTQEKEKEIIEYISKELETEISLLNEKI